MRRRDARSSALSRYRVRVVVPPFYLRQRYALSCRIFGELLLFAKNLCLTNLFRELICLSVIWRTTDTSVFTLHQSDSDRICGRYHFGALDGSRTHSLRRRRATLYPIALRVRIFARRNTPRKKDNYCLSSSVGGFTETFTCNTRFTVAFKISISRLR